MTARVRSTVAAAESRVATRGVDGRLGGVALRDERLLARKRRLGVLQLRKAVGEVGLLDRIVDIDQQRAALRRRRPNSKWIAVTIAGRLRRDERRPGYARNVPIAVSSGGHFSTFTASAATAVGFGAKAAVMKPLTIGWA